jgi:multidrug transporter EmrE-like cation transporter
MVSILLVGVVVLAGTGGELAATHAVRQSGEVKDFSLGTLLRILGRAFRRRWMWTGIGLMMIAFYSLLALLSREPVSLAIPATSLSYVAGALGAQVFLGEQVSRLRWLGVTLVCAGVALAWVG